MSKHIDANDSKIKILEEKLSAVEEANDVLEQYSLCANLHVCGIAEVDGWKDVKMLAVLNGKMGMQPHPFSDSTSSERSHHLGRKWTATVHTAVVRFTSGCEMMFTEFHKKLKTQNDEYRDRQIYINEYLTARRSSRLIMTLAS